MKYTIHPGTESPAYLQLYKQVREDIVQGIYPYNTKLPSKRMIADEVRVSTVTVEQSTKHTKHTKHRGRFCVFPKSV